MLDKSQKKLLTNQARDYRLCLGHQKIKVFGRIFMCEYHHPKKPYCNSQYYITIFYYIYKLYNKNKYLACQSLLVPQTILSDSSTVALQKTYYIRCPK